MSALTTNATIGADYWKYVSSALPADRTFFSFDWWSCYWGWFRCCLIWIMIKARVVSCTSHPNYWLATNWVSSSAVDAMTVQGQYHEALYFYGGYHYLSHHHLYHHRYCLLTSQSCLYCSSYFSFLVFLFRTKATWPLLPHIALCLSFYLDEAGIGLFRKFPNYS